MIEALLPSLSISYLSLASSLQICVCKCEAETACVACNWVCPPTTLQQRQRRGRLHWVRHNRYVHTLITALSHRATEPQHWRAISRGSSVLCCGFRGLTLSLEHNLSLLQQTKICGFFYLLFLHKNLALPVYTILYTMYFELCVRGCKMWWSWLPTFFFSATLKAIVYLLIYL